MEQEFRILKLEKTMLEFQPISWMKKEHSRNSRTADYNFENQECLDLTVLGLQQIRSSTKNISLYWKYKDEISDDQANQLTQKMRAEVSR